MSYIKELEKSEESFQEKKDVLQTAEVIEKTYINVPPCNPISTSEEVYSPETDDLQTTEATEKTCTNELPHYPASTSNLPEIASQFLRYYGKIYNLLFITMIVLLMTLFTHYDRHLESSLQRMA